LRIAGVVAGDRASGAVHHLVDEGFVQADLAAGCAKDEVATGVKLQAVRALEGDLNDPRVSPGGHDEIVLEMTLVAVID
jgi:hypothetical protein